MSSITTSPLAPPPPPIPALASPSADAGAAAAAFGCSSALEEEASPGSWSAPLAAIDRGRDGGGDGMGRR